MENTNSTAYPFIIVDSSDSPDVECRTYTLPEFDELLNKIDSPSSDNSQEEYFRVRYRLVLNEKKELKDSIFLGYGDGGFLDQIRGLTMFNDYFDEIDAAINGVYDQQGQKPYMAIFYEGEEKQTIYADSHDGAIDAVKQYKKEVRDIERCYIRKYDQEDGKYKQEGIYLISSGKDITPIEIELPQMDKSSFEACIKDIKKYGAKYNSKKKSWFVPRSTPPSALQAIDDIIEIYSPSRTYLELPSLDHDKYVSLTNKIKEDGAKFDVNKKLWYITRSCDFNKFKDYMPKERASVTGKLKKYKKELAEKEKEDPVKEQEQVK